MRPVWPVAVALVGMCSLCLVEQPFTSAARPDVADPLNTSTNLTHQFGTLDFSFAPGLDFTQGGNTNLDFLAARGNAFEVLTNAQLAGRHRPARELQLALGNVSPNALKPGVYETAPYTCIVVVPGSHPDDTSVISPGPTRPLDNMPVVKPELRFIPRTGK